MSEPPFVNDLPYCAWAALRLLREREAGYKRRVLSGKMTQQDASDRLSAARAIVDQWRWAIDPAMPAYPADDAFASAPFGASEAAMVEQLRDTAAWERARWKKAPEDAERRERTLLAEALLWHQLPPSPLSWCPIVAYGFAARRAVEQRFVVDPIEDEWIYRELGLSLPALKRAA